MPWCHPQALLPIPKSQKIFPVSPCLSCQLCILSDRGTVTTVVSSSGDLHGHLKLTEKSSKETSFRTSWPDRAVPPYFAVASGLDDLGQSAWQPPPTPQVGWHRRRGQASLCWWPHSSNSRQGTHLSTPLSCFSFPESHLGLEKSHIILVWPSIKQFFMI